MIIKHSEADKVGDRGEPASLALLLVGSTHLGQLLLLLRLLLELHLRDLSLRLGHHHLLRHLLLHYLGLCLKLAKLVCLHEVLGLLLTLLLHGEHWLLWDCRLLILNLVLTV